MTSNVSKNTHTQCKCRKKKWRKNTAEIMSKKKVDSLNLNSFSSNLKQSNVNKFKNVIVHLLSFSSMFK